MQVYLKLLECETTEFLRGELHHGQASGLYIVLVGPYLLVPCQLISPGARRLVWGTTAHRYKDRRERCDE